MADLPSPDAVPMPRLDARVRNRRGTILVACAQSVFELSTAIADVTETLVDLAAHEIVYFEG